MCPVGARGRYLGLGDRLHMDIVMRVVCVFEWGAIIVWKQGDSERFGLRRSCKLFLRHVRKVDRRLIMNAVEVLGSIERAL